MEKIVLESIAEFESEDGGQARIAEICEEKRSVYVRIISWSEDLPRKHPEVEKLNGKRVRVTIEMID